MTRIAVVIHSLGQGGTDRVAVHLANGLAETYATTLVAVAPGGSASAAFESQLSPRLELAVLQPVQRHRTLDYLTSVPAWIRWLRRERPDVVLATGNNISWFTAAGFLLRRNREARLFVKTTNPIVRPHDSGLHAAIRKAGYGLTFRAASGVLALSEAERRRLAALFPGSADKFRAVENPYVTDAMLSAGREPRGAERGGAKSVLAIGRLHHQKNFQLLLRAWARLGRQDAHLTILGEGPDEAKLKALSQELGIEGRVTFAGYAADVVPWLRKADLFVLSSRYEGLPAVIFEAMAFDCPIVSTDCFEAARELVGSAEGCTVVPPDDPAALAAAIGSALERPERPHLRPIAERYSLAAAIESHRAAMGLAG